MSEVAAGFQPFAPGYTDDPYPAYATLREAMPIEQHELGFWAMAPLRVSRSRRGSSSSTLRSTVTDSSGPNWPERVPTSPITGWG